MLECAALFIGPWLALGGGIARAISHGETMAPLGVVRRVASPRWWPWPCRGMLHVLETEAEALLFSLQGPSWLGTWHYHDAEERYLGRLMRNLRLLDATGQEIARLRREERKSRWVNPTGKELASFQPFPGPIEVHVSQEQASSPFRRMLLLGAVIALLDHGS